MTVQNREQAEAGEEKPNGSAVTNQGEPGEINTSSALGGLEIADTREPGMQRSNTVRIVMGNKKLCLVASCCCAMLIYFLAVISLLIVLVAVAGEASNCERDLEQIEKSNCLSNNVDLDYIRNSTFTTEIEQCTILGITYENCPIPKTTYAPHEMLSTERITTQIGYESQCALDNRWSIGQDYLWIEEIFGRLEVYELGTATISILEGPILGYVPVCWIPFVEEPVLVNFTVNSLDGFVLESIIKVPLVIAELQSAISYESRIWPEWELPFNSTAAIPAELSARITATDVRLQKPSINRLPAIQLTNVSVSLEIRDLGDIVNFTFTAAACGLVLNYCDMVEDYMRERFESVLEGLVVDYLNTKFVEIAPEIEELVKAISYSEIDSAGLYALCILADCHDMTTSDFVDRIVVLFWIQIGLLCIFGITMCYFCILLSRERQVRKQVKTLGKL